MIDVMTKLKEIADSGYDNEDIQRGITAASKHQVNEDVQSEYKELLGSLKGQNERKRAKMLADFADKHKLDGMYDPESGYFVYSGNEGPEIAGSGSMKALKALDAMGLVPDNVRAAKGLPPREKAKPSGGDADPAGMTGADAAATRPNPTTVTDFGGDDTPDDEPDTAPSVAAAPNPTTAKDFGGDDTPDDAQDRGVEVIDLMPATASGTDDDDDNERIDPGMPPSGPAGVGAGIRKGKYNRDAINMNEIEEVHEDVEEDTGLEDILRLAGRSGVLGMNKPVSIVAESLELDEDEVVEVGMSDLRAELMQKMDYIEELMGGEKLLNEIIMGMTTDELKDNVEWISQHHDIKFPGEEDNIEEEDKVAECDAVEEEAVEETVEVPVSTLTDLMRLAGYTDYQEQVDEYANDPAEEYMDAEDQLIGLSGGMNGPKKMYPAAAGGDNPMDQEPREIEEVAEAEEDLTSSFYKKYDAFLESLNKDN